MIPKDLKVLLIEDDPGFTYLVHEYLITIRSPQVRIEDCKRLSEGLAHLSESSSTFDLILVDLILPDSYGLETFSKIHQKVPELPIVILSGLEDEGIAIQAVRDGAQDYLVKGDIGRDLLWRVMRYAIERMKIAGDLRRARDDLEERVRERTAELAAANETLKEMVSKVSAAGEAVCKSLQGIIRVISLIIETRDPYTAGHQRGVADLARSIARVMDLPPERIEGIRLAAIVHDLGKISVPAEILAKPSRLTEAEMSIIRIHPQSGYEILKKVEFPWPIAQIVLQHHERIDGSGYPQGLCGPDILLEAKILGVADVVDAMCSHRPYRPAIGLDKALAEITQNRGILYDPEVVDACLKYFQEKLATLPLTKKSYKHLVSSQPALPVAP
jgi:putative nucleotidyltransferase with HDIG domain